ncbi:hypothetical protein ILYODFUR_026003 [Ilyodon furcidens]|uniref:Uncharacterized protein n=1 Tax=Ilyodon furcidens TaxID=33524 RepID=A0ABV0VH79_9TELE
MDGLDQTRMSHRSRQNQAVAGQSAGRKQSCPRSYLKPQRETTQNFLDQDLMFHIHQRILQPVYWLSSVM